MWLSQDLLLGVPHRQVVFTIPKLIRPFFRYRRALLSDLCLSAVSAVGQYMKTHAGKDLMPGVVAVIQTFGNHLNFHPHLHMLVTEGGRTSDGSFEPVPIFNDAVITRIFAGEVLAFLVSRDLMSPETRGMILSWRHTGFNIHSKVRTASRGDARRVAKYMAKPILALGRLSFDEDQGKVMYQYGDADAERVEMDYLDFIARLTAHIPDKGQVMIRYYGLYSNAHRGMERKRGAATTVPSVLTPPPTRTASPGWRELIRKVYEVDPLICPACGTEMKVIAFIANYAIDPSDPQSRSQGSLCPLKALSPQAIASPAVPRASINPSILIRPHHPETRRPLGLRNTSGTRISLHAIESKFLYVQEMKTGLWRQSRTAMHIHRNLGYINWPLKKSLCARDDRSGIRNPAH
jgi:hypothetical protein